MPPLPDGCYWDNMFHGDGDDRCVPQWPIVDERAKDGISRSFGIFGQTNRVSPFSICTRSKSCISDQICLSGAAEGRSTHKLEFPPLILQMYLIRGDSRFPVILLIKMEKISWPPKAARFVLKKGRTQGGGTQAHGLIQLAFDIFDCRQSESGNDEEIIMQ